MRMRQVRKASDAGGLEFECAGVRGDLLQFRLEATDFIDGNGGSEEFQRQMEIGGRDPFDAVIVDAQLGDDIFDRAPNFGADPNRDEGADLFGRLRQW